MVNREADAQRRQSKDRSHSEARLLGGNQFSACLFQDAALQEQEEQNRHAERLNDTLFVLTTATTLFAPVQFLAGSSLKDAFRSRTSRFFVQELQVSMA